MTLVNPAGRYMRQNRMLLGSAIFFHESTMLSCGASNLLPMLLRLPWCKTLIVLSLATSCLGLSGCIGCNQRQSPDQVRERTAAATADLKQNAKAVAEGVREGWSRDKIVDVNKAGKAELMTLPGMTSEDADKVIAGRPYISADELESRHILSRGEYNRIADHLTVKK